MHDLNVYRRFFAKVGTPNQGCWPWLGAKNGHGYGNFYFEGKATGAHRVAKILNNEPPANATDEIDHLCLNKGCVNPQHLEWVPFVGRENTRRHQAAKTHCPKGHPYDETNTYIQIVNGRRKRSCRVCRNAAAKRSHAKRRQ